MNKTAAVVFACALALSMAMCDYKPRNHGRALYETHCQSCHMENGQGLRALYPPVANSDYVLSHSEELACIIRVGMKEEIIVNDIVFQSEMPGNSSLSETEISNLVYYIMREQNAMDTTFSIGQIRKQLENCPLGQ